MLRSVLVASSLVALALGSLIGCAEPQVVEEEGESSSHQTAKTAAYPKSSHDRILDTLEEKANNCDVFNDAEIKTLESYNSHVEWNFEGYVSFTCTIEEGELIVGSIAMETRAGWSSSDGVFTEDALDGTASVQVPLKAVTVSGSITSSVTVRSAHATVKHNQSVSASVGVSKSIGIAEAAASVSFDGNGSVSIAGGVSAPLPINLTSCNGKEKVGFTLSLSANQVLDNHGLSDVAARALRARAVKIEERGHSNFLATSAPGDSKATQLKLHQECCDGWKTCS